MCGADSSADALFSFGLVADVQAADKPNHVNDTGRVQYFATAAARLGAAVDAWRKLQPGFVLSLGDIVDGREDEEATRADLATCTGPLSRLECPVVHVVGNHCLKFLPRDELLAALGMGPAAYFRFDLPAQWRLIVLDTTDLSIHGRWAEGSSQLAEAQAYLAAHPPGEAGAADERPRMKRYNGGVGSAQLGWLRSQLAQAAADGCRVIVASHHCFARGACRETHRAWNGDEVTQLLLESGVVALALAGHDHPGGFAWVGGVPFVTVEALLEAPAEPGNAFGMVRVWSDRIEIDGCGTSTTTRSLPLPPWRPPALAAPAGPALVRQPPSMLAPPNGPRTFSVWLLPDESHAALIGVRMRHTASAHGLPSAAPHVTMLGSVGSLPHDEAIARLQRLRGFGEVSLRFEGIACADAWNQRAAAVASDSAALLALHLKTRELFEAGGAAGGAGEGTAGQPSWAPPLRKPHLSLAYGLDAAHAAELELPPELVAGSIALVDCTPPTLEGVPGWREVARVSLRRAAPAKRDADAAVVRDDLVGGMK